MSSTIRRLTACLIVCLGAGIGRAAEIEQPTVSDFRALASQVEASELPEELVQQVAALCDSGTQALEAAANARAEMAAIQRSRRAVDRELAALTSELEQAEPRPTLQLPDIPTLPQAEDALARERSRLAANLAALREQQQIADDRSTRRSTLAQRLGELDHELDRINRDLRNQLDSSARSELRTAARWQTLARKQAADAEVELLRAQLALLADRSSLVPMQIDLAQRRVANSRRSVELYLRRTKELRAEIASESLDTTRAAVASLKRELPRLAELADETEALAARLWDPEDGVLALHESAITELQNLRNHQVQLHRIIELMARKYTAYGHRGSIQRWWPDVPDDFPEIASLTSKLEWLDREIPEVEHWLINAEQSRSKAAELTRRTVLDLSEELGDSFSPELEQDVLGLLNSRQDLLDELIERGGRYSNHLTEYRSVVAGFIVKLKKAEEFLFNQVLWSRSVPRPVVPRPADIASAFRWYVSSDHLAQLESSDGYLRGLVLFGLILVLLILFRSRLQGRLESLGRRALDPGKDSPLLSVRALVVTGLLAAPVPLALVIAGRLIDHFGASAYWQAGARACFFTAAIAAVLELTRQVFSPTGLAEAHFGWPITATGPMSRGLVVIQLVGLPPLFAALHIAFAGMGFYNPDELQLHNNTLGRVLFIASLLFIGTTLLGLLRPEKKTEPDAHDIRVPWPRQFSDYAFPTAFLGAYPVILLATIVPALLAVFGFYVTGFLLGYQMLRTLMFGIVVLLVAGLVHRWRSTERRRLAAERAADGDDDSARHDELEVAADQTRDLFRFTVVSVLLVGLFVIWSDAMPMLQQLKRVQLLPRVAVLEPIDRTPGTLLASTRSSAETEQSQAPGPSEPPSDSTVGDATGETGRAPSPSNGSAPLTLWSLMEAILAAVVTFVLVRNLPGVIEILLQRRTKLDSGARVAFSTLVRYTTTIIGTIAVFGLLGIGWSKVQWLAAALTFGLGFGLQEIVANFVSGIILLVERPVRIGDVVTIGNLMGRVSRIQIRATTITLWDRSEMIVPNKEFITTKLVNWTLSDSKRRIEIPLRVAYGADLEQVKRLLVEAAEAHPMVLEDPAPHALLIAFGDDAINFELRFVVDFGNGIQAKDDVQMAIDSSFRQHDIEFALPQLRLQLPGGAAPAPG